MIAYKIVRSRDGELTSLNAGEEVSDLQISARMIYPPNQWVEAKAGGLLCFEAVLDALAFVNHISIGECYILYQGLQIWKVEVEEKISLGPFCVIWECLTIDMIDKLWNNGHITWEDVDGPNKDFAKMVAESGGLTSGDWPKGTTAYRKVKLVSKLTRVEIKSGAYENEMSNL